MRIAFVGKGGSGKSTASWLFINHLASLGEPVAAIDADHNMDTASLLGFDYRADTPTFHRLHDEFRDMVGQKEDKHWHNIVLDGRPLPTFKIKPADDFSKKILLSVAPNIDLMLVGLGSDDILYSARCAHGHSAPLKFYLGLLADDPGATIIIDSVAGADMFNFGLYAGVDLVVGVVEPQLNSMKVFGQLKNLADRLGVPMVGLVNKPVANNFLLDLRHNYQDVLIGEVPVDQAIGSYDFDGLADDTRLRLADIWRKIKEKAKPENRLERLRDFEKKRHSDVNIK